jgi:hypothetical protein
VAALGEHFRPHSRSGSGVSPRYRDIRDPDNVKFGPGVTHSDDDWFPKWVTLSGRSAGSWSELNSRIKICVVLRDRPGREVDVDHGWPAPWQGRIERVIAASIWMGSAGWLWRGRKREPWIHRRRNIRKTTGFA